MKEIMKSVKNRWRLNILCAICSYNGIDHFMNTECLYCETFQRSAELQQSTL